MPYIEFEVREYAPHPEGTFAGTILSIEDKGVVKSQYGEKQKISIQIQSDDQVKEDGTPLSIWKWVNVSGSPKSALYSLRRSLLGRDLTADERQGFDSAELLGRRVTYQVVHQEREDGQVWANVENIWPQVEAQSQPEITPASSTTTESDDDLPF